MRKYELRLTKKILISY